MGSYLDLHKKRMKSPGYNSDFRTLQSGATKDFIEVSFSQSPLYKVVNIEGRKYDVRVWEDKINKGVDFFEQKELLFRPDIYVAPGSYVKLENPVTKNIETWLILYYKADEFTPRAYIRKCTKEIEYKGDIYPCVVTTSVSSSSEIVSNGEVLLPKGHKLVYLKSTQSTMGIQEKERFILDGDVYAVQTIEKTINTEDGIGVIMLTMKQVPQNHKEQLEIGISNTEQVIVDENNVTPVNNPWNRW